MGRSDVFLLIHLPFRLYKRKLFGLAVPTA